MAFNMKHKRFSLFIYFYGYNLYSFYLRLDLQYRWNLKSVNRSHTAPPVKCFHPVWIHFDIMLSSDMSADLIMPETKASKVTAFVNSTCAHVWVFFLPWGRALVEVSHVHESSTDGLVFVIETVGSTPTLDTIQRLSPGVPSNLHPAITNRFTRETLERHSYPSESSASWNIRKWFSHFKTLSVKIVNIFCFHTFTGENEKMLRQRNKNHFLNQYFISDISMLNWY